MADIHVLDRVNGDYRFAYHISVPNANNSAGINYRTALINSKLGGTTILPDGDGTAGTISAAEKASIVSGALVEVIQTFDPTANGTVSGAALLAAMSADYAENSATLRTKYQNRLAHFGRTI